MFGKKGKVEGKDLWKSTEKSKRPGKKVEGKDLWKSTEKSKLPRSSRRTDRKYEKLTGRNPRTGKGMEGRGRGSR